MGLSGASVRRTGVLLGGDAELVVEGVVPDLLHVVPVGHDAVLDGVLEGQDTALALRLVSDVRILLAHADHDAVVSRSTDDGRKHRLRGVVAREPGFHHPRPVIAHQRGHFALIRHRSFFPSRLRRAASSRFRRQSSLARRADLDATPSRLRSRPRLRPSRVSGPGSPPIRPPVRRARVPRSAPSRARARRRAKTAETRVLSRRIESINGWLRTSNPSRSRSVASRRRPRARRRILASSRASRRVASRRVASPRLALAHTHRRPSSAAISRSSQSQSIASSRSRRRECRPGRARRVPAVCTIYKIRNNRVYMRSKTPMYLYHIAIARAVVRDRDRAAPDARRGSRISI